MEQCSSCLNKWSGTEDRIGWDCVGRRTTAITKLSIDRPSLPNVSKAVSACSALRFDGRIQLPPPADFSIGNYRMPLFFFDLHDGELCFTDKLGQDTPSREHAKNIALAMLPELVGTTDATQDRRRLRVEVRDERGAVVLTTCLCISSKWSE